jgi:hypothetical protein
MQLAPTVLSQITDVLYPAEFERCVQLFPSPRCSRALTSYDHFLALCFGQLTYRESLRDIVSCLGARRTCLYHLGFRGKISRTNLAYANHHRDWRLFEAVAQVLMREPHVFIASNKTIPIFPKWPLLWTHPSFPCL